MKVWCVLGSCMEPRYGQGSYKNHSYKNHQRIQDSVVHVSDCSGCIPPFELALKERYENKKILLQEGAEETPRHVDLGEI
jgi:hypothetical protein